MIFIHQKINWPNLINNFFFLLLASFGLFAIYHIPNLRFIDAQNIPLFRSWLLIIITVCILQKIHWHYIFYAMVTMVMISTQHTFVLLGCWEIIAVFGSMIIWKQLPYKTTNYLIMHTLSGALIIAGLATQHFNQTHFDSHSGYLLSFDISTFLIFTGILVNCAIFPFSDWLLRVYPHLKIENLLILSSFTTKAAIVILAIAQNRGLDLNHYIFDPLHLDALGLPIFFLYIFLFLTICALFSRSLMRSLCFLMIFVLTNAALYGITNNDFIYIVSKSVLYQSLLFLCSYFNFFPNKNFAGKFLINTGFLIGIFAASELPCWPNNSFAILIYMMKGIILCKICILYLYNKEKHILFDHEQFHINNIIAIIFLTVITIILIIFPSIMKFYNNIANYNPFSHTIINVIKCIAISIPIHFLFSFTYKFLPKNISIISSFQHLINHIKSFFSVLYNKFINQISQLFDIIAKKIKKIEQIFYFNIEKTVFFLVLLIIVLINCLL